MEKLAHNYHALRQLTPYGTKFMGLVKADAYGHGAVPVAKKLEELGADYLGVACLDEAIELREAGIQAPILILGCTPSFYGKELMQYNITQACYDLSYAKALSAEAQSAGGTITVHIQCDTGMTRLGFLCDEAHMTQSAQEITEAVRLPGLHAEGIFTHFSDSDGSEEYTMMQFNRFLDIIQKVKELGYEFAIRHCANSAATLLYPATYLDCPLWPFSRPYNGPRSLRPGPRTGTEKPCRHRSDSPCRNPGELWAHPHTPAGLPLGSDSHRLWGWILPGLFQPDYCTSPWKKRPCDGQNLHGYVYGGCYGPARCQRRRRGHPLRQ